MTNLTPLSLQVRHGMVCLPGGSGCSGPMTSPISPSVPHVEQGTTYYLPDAGTYQVVFAWEITDPAVGNSRATTPNFGSIFFDCEQLAGPAEQPR